MPDKETGGAAYIHRVRQDTERFVEDVLKENDTLRARAAALQGEKLSLWEEIQTLRKEMERHRWDQAHLQLQLADVEAQNKRFSEEYVRVEQQNANLANLYVVSYRLHGTLDRKEVLEIMQETIINLIGSEEFAIFERTPEGSALALASSFGVEEGRFGAIPLGVGLIGQTARTGETYVAGLLDDRDRQPAEADLTACIPLKVDGKITGAIAVFRLLQQKSGLEALDFELFDLLATHAATALYCAELHARAGAALVAAA